jgi:SAM-dependent methyltransferase
LDTAPDTFDPKAFARLAAAEPGHFWFEERRELIAWAIRHYFPAAKDFCEVGCGTGFVLAGLESGLPGLNLTGIEYYPEGLPFANARLTRTRLLEGNICQLPFREEFDVVGCFDVLEHIPDDQLALANLVASLRPGGGLILTVPQHPALWGVADEIGHHQRRYTRRELQRKLTGCGLVCRRMTSFMSFLLPVMWLSRRLARQVDVALGELTPSPAANWIGRTLLHLERRLVAGGVSFPFGGSLLVIATKPTA